MNDIHTAVASDLTYDVAVIGGGAAGLSASILLGRARRRVVVIDSGRPRNAPAAHMHGFLSRDGLPPATLLAMGRGEAESYGVDFITGQVEHLEPGFQVRLDGGALVRARRLLCATGLRDELPDIPGVHERWGKDLLHCPYCHAYEVRDQPLAVIGTHSGAVHQALLLRQWSSDVLFFAHTLALSPQDHEQLEARGVRIVTGTVVRLVTDDGLRGIELDDGSVVFRSAAFVFPSPVPHDALMAGLGCAKDADGWIVADRTGRTSVPGVWAAGNVVDPRAQVAAAAGMGSSAGFAINTSLLQEDVEQAVVRHRAGRP